MSIDPISGLTIYSALGTSPLVNQLLANINEKFTGLNSYEKILFKCYSKAVKKEIRRNYKFSIKRFNLKWDTTILQEALDYFNNDNVNSAYKLIEKYYGSNNINFNSIKENFEICIKKKSNYPLLTHIIIESFKSQEAKLNSLIKSQDISDELKYGNTFEATLQAIEEEINNGELLEAYYRIKSIINLDELNKAKKYRDKIILFETKIIIMRELEQDYKFQLEKLIQTENSFLKYYYQLRLFHKLKKEEGFDNFTIKYGGQEYVEELKLSFLHLLESNEEFNSELESKFDTFTEESKKILLKSYLVSCINSFNAEYNEELINDNLNLISDHESQFYICILKLNKFWKSKSIIEFSISEIAFLQTCLEKMIALKNKFKEYSHNFQSSINYNIALTKIYLKLTLKEFEQELEDFINMPDLLGRFFGGLKSFRRFKDIIYILNKFNLTFHKDYLNDYVDALFMELNFEELIKIDLSNNDLSIDSKAKIVTAKNFFLYKEKKESYTEIDIELLPENPEHPIILESIVNIFSDKGDNTTAVKYFNMLYKSYNECIEQDKLVIMKLAELIGKTDIEEIIIEDLITLKTQYKIAKAKYYQRITNHFSDYLPKVDHFFSSINLDDDLPVELFRIKSDYLRVSGETDKFLILTKSLIDLYDNEGDWFLYIGALIDFGRFDQVEDLIPEISKRLENPLFELIISICYLNIESSLEKKLLNFSIHFIQAFRKIKILKQKFSEEILFPILSTLLINQLFFKYEKNYTKEDCYVQLKDKENLESMVICIHENKELCINFEDDYLDAKHIHKDDEIIKGILLKEVGSEVLFLNKTYTIEKVDSILNFPAFYLSNLVFSNPQKYGLKKFEVGPDPVVTIHPQMLEIKKQHDQIFSKYSIKKLTIHILAGRDYLNYVQTIQRLLFVPDLPFNAGFGINYKMQEKFVITYSSLIVLELLDKLRTIPEEKIIIPNSLIDVVNKHFQVMKSGIDNTKLSLDLDLDLIPYKIEITPDINLKETQKWRDFLTRLKKFETFDTALIEDDLIPLIKLIGKIEVDCIRISRMKQIPIILDDYLVQEFMKFQNVSNLLGLYFFHSRDNLEDKLRLMITLSQMNYKYLLFEGLIEDIINQIINENYTLFGNNTVIGNFIELIRLEINKEDKNLQYAYFLNGCNLLVYNYLNPTMERILKSLISLLKENDKTRLFSDLINLNISFEERIKYIKYCFS